MIENHKQTLRDLAPVGWAYTGFDDEYYLFQTGNYQTGFREMRCIGEDLTVDNLSLMAKMGVTR